MLRLEGVTVRYGAVQVLFGIDLEVGDGEVVALLGTNGAGKTTVLRAISGVLPVSGGRLEWNGESLSDLRPPEIVRRGVVHMPGGRGVFRGMTVDENLAMGGFLYGRDRARRRGAIERVYDLFPAISARRRQVVASLSGGEQQMVALAKAFVMDPRLLLIDELSLGLSPVIVEELLEVVRRLNRDGAAVLLVDQHVDLALDIATRAYFIERGEIRFSGPSEDLRGRNDLLRAVFLRAESKRPRPERDTG